RRALERVPGVEVQRSRGVRALALDDGGDARDAAEVAIAGGGVGIGALAVLRIMAARRVEAEGLVDPSRRELVRHQARVDVRGVEDGEPHVEPAQIHVWRLHRARSAHERRERADTSHQRAHAGRWRTKSGPAQASKKIVTECYGRFCAAGALPLAW